MFGLLYTLSYLFGSGYEHLRRHMSTRNGKRRGIEKRINGENYKNIYSDWQGIERDINTNKKVMFYFDRNNHYVEQEVGGRIIRDFTQEEFDRRIEYNATHENEDQIVLLYDWRQLQKMWNDRYYKKDSQSEHKRLPKDWKTNIYLFCKNKSMCLKNGMSKEIKEQYSKIIEQSSGHQNINEMYLIIDLKTKMILDVNHTDYSYEGISYLTDYKDVHGLRESKKLTREEELKSIDSLNFAIQNGIVPKVQSSWSEFFFGEEH